MIKAAAHPLPYPLRDTPVSKPQHQRPNPALVRDLPPAPTPTSEAHFVSEHAALIVYHDGVKVARFTGGRFSTDEPALVSILRACPLCHEA